MNNVLTPEMFFKAIDYDRPAGNTIRNAFEWWRLYEYAAEQVTKYGLDGALIPIGAKVRDVGRAEVLENRKRGHNGIVGAIFTFCGISERDSRYFLVDDRFLINRSCWWRYLAVVDDDD